MRPPGGPIVAHAAGRVRRQHRPGGDVGIQRIGLAPRRSEYDGLKDVAQSASLGRFKGRLAFLQDLDALGPTQEWLEGVPPGKIAHFSGEARVTDVADLRRVLDEDKRLTLILSLLHTARTGVREATFLLNP
jgi:hypothetical protein